MEKRDAKILSYIAKPKSHEKVLDKFGDTEETRSRLAILMHNPKTNERLIWLRGNGLCALTGDGERTLRDYKDRQSARRTDIMLKLWIPLMISLAALGVSVFGLFRPVLVRLM